MIINKELAYSIDVPEKVMPTAKIQKVGGMTRKCANLWTLGDIVSTGYTYDVANAFKSLLPNKQYTWTCKYSSNGTKDAQNQIIVYTDAGGINVGNGIPFTITEAQLNTIQGAYAYFGSDVTSGSMTEIMLNEGEPKPYEPYFEGLRSAKVTEVKSVGENLFDPQKIIDAGGTENNGEYIVDPVEFHRVWDGKDLSSVPCKKGTRYIVGFEGRNDNTADRAATIIFTIVYADESQSTMAFVKTNEWCYAYAVSTAGKDVLRIGVTYSYSGVSYLRNVFIAEYTGDNSYTPYAKRTLPIPEAVRPVNGINENVYDYIEWAEDGNRKQVVRCGVVDLGTLEWRYNASTQTFFVEIKDGKYKSNNALMPKYSKVNEGDIFTTDKAFTFGSNFIGGGACSFVIHDTAYTDAATFKAAMSGVMLYYELAEPIVTDISDLITADNLIGVEGGGTLTFENEYGYAVPSEVIFKEATLENYAESIVQNLKKIGTYLGVKNKPQSTSSILDGMDDSALKSTLVSDSPAQSIHILSGRKAYVNGKLVVGEYDVEAEIPDYYFDIRPSDAGPNDVKKGKYYFGVGPDGNIGGYYGNYVVPPLRNDGDIDVFYDEIIHIDIPDGTYGSPNNEYSGKVVIELPSTVLDTKTSNPVTSKAMLDGYIGYANGESIVGSIPEVSKSDFKIELRPGEAIDVTIPYGYKESSETITVEGYYNDTELDSSLAVLSNDIRNGKCAYANGKLVVGSVKLGFEIGITADTLNEDGVDGLIEITIPDGIYDTEIKKTFADSDSLKIRNTAYKTSGDFAKSEHILRDRVAYADGQFLYGSIDTNGSDAITTDVEENKVVVNVSGGYYDGDMKFELPDTITDVFGASEVDPLEIPKGLVVYGIGKTKLEGLYTKYYAKKVNGNADVFKSKDILIQPTLFDDGRYGMALYDGFYSDARAILPSTNWVDTSAGDLYAITEDLIPRSHVGYVDGKKIIGCMVYNTSDSISMGIFNNTTLSPTTVTVSVTVDKGFYEADTPKSLTLRPGIVDSAVLPDGKNYAYNGSLLEGYVAYANGSQIIGNMPFWRYGTGYSVEKNADGKRVNYAVDLGYHQGGSSILDDEILYTGGDNGTLYSHSEEGDDGLWYSDSLAKGVTACANGEVIHGTSTYYYGKSLFIDFTDPVIPDGIYSDSRVYIPGGFVDTSDATISAVRYGDTWISEHVVSGKTVYARGVKVIGTRPSEDTLTWYDGDFGATILDDETTYVIELYDRSDMANNRTMATVYTSVKPTIYDNGIVYLKDPYDPNTSRAFMIVVDRTHNNPTLMLYQVLSAFPDELYEVDVSGYGYRYARISM